MTAMRMAWVVGVVAVARMLPGCGEDKSGRVGDAIVDTAAEVDTASPTDAVAPDMAVTDVAPETADTQPIDTTLMLDVNGDDTKVSAETSDTAQSETVDTVDAGSEALVGPPKEVRFVVLGDTGEGNESQKKVAEQIRVKCAAAGCDLALLLGDNIYNAGVESTLDAQWAEKFEIPFANVDLPFYAVLGNHDNGGFLTQFLGDTFGGAGAEFERGDYQVAYTQLSTKWKMPGRTYDFALGPAHFFALDTNDMVWSYGNAGAEARAQWQVDTLPGRIDAATETWRIAFGHHPFISNGTHGNAGEYEGLEEGITDLISGLPGIGDLSAVVTGDGVKESLDVIVCGRVDLYFAGHDHSRQWHVPSDACPGTTFVVSGAGSKLSKLKGDQPVRFENVTKPGFFWVHLKDNTIEVEAIDEDGTSEWSWQGSK